MQLPTLITSSAPQKHESNLNSIWLQVPEDKTLISIEQVHDLKIQLALSSGAQNIRTIVISPADKLSLPAQQALLKTLEEPPENTQIVLVTKYPNKLLPTILSRAVAIQESGIRNKESRNESNTDTSYAKLKMQNVATCLKLSDEWSKDKESAVEKLRDLVIEVRHQSHSDPSSKILGDEKALMACIEQLEGNINAKLALDHLFFVLSGKI